MSREIRREYDQTSGADSVVLTAIKHLPRKEYEGERGWGDRRFETAPTEIAEVSFRKAYEPTSELLYIVGIVENSPIAPPSSPHLLYFGDSVNLDSGHVRGFRECALDQIVAYKTIKSFAVQR